MDAFVKREMDFSGIVPFHMQITYSEIDRFSPNNQYDSHVHPECEIYINLTGDVSFMVERHIYPVTSGSVILSRPYEYHHCIYHSDEPHKHFWILFSSVGNESLFPRFFQRDRGQGNLLILSAHGRAELIALCHSMMNESMTDVERYAGFFRMMALLEGANTFLPHQVNGSEAVAAVLAIIEEGFSEPLSVETLAESVHLSVNTLERKFSKILHMSPSVYLKKKRLANAALLLYEGDSVSEACWKSGFSDYSHFIATFKAHYSMTPLQYKKAVRGSGEQASGQGGETWT